MPPAEQLCEIARRTYERGLVAGAEGNLSLRLAPDRVLCTPSGRCKGRLSPQELCVVALDGRQLEGSGTPSSEIRLHLAIYRAADAQRLAIHAVVHTHSSFATTLALLGQSVPAGLLPEADVLLGPIPLVPYRTPGTNAVGDAVVPHVARGVSAILANHGAVAWGRDAESALLNAETLESVCRVYCQARALGAPVAIPPEMIPALRDARGRRVAADA
ncbi:MAG: class II aldolase/adducin family protein [Planctomycetia bacterium]|nr:MAG: class II aldolase/adducin family protein [Planctomycetia bacterium]